MAGANSNAFQHALVVKDLASLASVHVAELDFGAQCWVEAVGAHFSLTQTPSMPPDGATVVAPVPQAGVGKPGAAWEKGGGGGGTDELEGVTLAQLAGITGADASSVIYVFDTHAIYRWTPGGAATADGWVIVNAPGGQWMLQGETMVLTPLGGGVDDWARVFGTGGAAAAAATSGIQMVLAGTPWNVATNQFVPSGLSFTQSPESEIVSTLPATGVFPGNYALHVDAPSAFQAGTLAATPAVGASALSLTLPAKPVVGQYIQLSHSVSAAVYEIVDSPSGSSPWTVTIDRPTNLPWAAGDIASSYATVPSNVTYEADGGSLTGTGDQLIQIVRARHVQIRGVIQTPDRGLPVALGVFDIGCYDGLLEDCQADLSGSTPSLGQTAFFVQSGELMVFRRLIAKNASISGMTIIDGFGCRIEDCHADQCSTGISITSFDVGSLGSYDNVVSSSSATACTVGCYVAQVASAYANVVDQFSAVACVTGILVGAGSVAARITSADTRNCGTGVLVNGASGTQIVALRADNSTTVALGVVGDLDLTGMVSSCDYASNGIINLAGAGPWTLRGLQLTQANAGGYHLFINGAGRLEVDGGVLSGGAVVGIFINAAAQVFVQNVKIAAASQGIFVAAGATLTIGPNVDLSGCASPVTGTGTVIGQFYGINNIAMAGADHTATWAEYAFGTITISGTLGSPRNLIFPMFEIPWSFKNNADQAVTVKALTGAGVSIAAGATARVIFDGTNFIQTA